MRNPYDREEEDVPDGEDLVDTIHDLLLGSDDAGVREVWKFDQTGVLSRDPGLVIVLQNGEKYQLTVVRDRRDR